ncbi:type I-Fv CRISPR-associated protein Cas5fv [Thiomicrorhabdus heinhorstiae]|uniref:Cas5fv helical domain-containing protein n=1 Tax=Thiomicrorhabdus heinhorstiae TaxID=2748010 RepID=A0ABS0BV45_9GAMM|nr:type I-Fv CRISPR-associated protein Cas5fv [Thiomicrorhabdus heinhorstiae]MBF6057701.1 hypothetical protein [Thiomicrorhabdus heinhorstiae]
MEIIIEYESSWRNSFLDGSNNEPLPKEGRKYIGSGRALEDSKNFLKREITIDTVLGILSRLIGDQRKLYQARASDNFYFFEIEDKTSWEDQADYWNETVYLRNMSGNFDQNSFTGSLKLNDPRLKSDYSQQLWGVLKLSPAELLDFFNGKKHVDEKIELTPFAILNAFQDIKAYKVPELEEQAIEVAESLKVQFDKSNAIGKNGKVKWESLYCTALYLQVTKLTNQFDMSSATTPRGAISGISFNGLTPKGFLSSFTTTGVMKKVWGNPYIMKERGIKGEGNRTSMLQKARGKLIITLDISKEAAKELSSLIDNAGVSSFYLGKKGLAYVTSIRV